MRTPLGLGFIVFPVVLIRLCHASLYYRYEEVDPEDYEVFRRYYSTDDYAWFLERINEPNVPKIAILRKLRHDIARSNRRLAERLFQTQMYRLKAFQNNDRHNPALLTMSQEARRIKRFLIDLEYNQRLSWLETCRLQNDLVLAQTHQIRNELGSTLNAFCAVGGRQLEGVAVPYCDPIAPEEDEPNALDRGGSRPFERTLLDERSVDDTHAEVNNHKHLSKLDIAQQRELLEELTKKFEESHRKSKKHRRQETNEAEKRVDEESQEDRAHKQRSHALTSDELTMLGDLCHRYVKKSHVERESHEEDDEYARKEVKNQEDRRKHIADHLKTAQQDGRRAEDERKSRDTVDTMARKSEDDDLKQKRTDDHRDEHHTVKEVSRPYKHRIAGRYESTAPNSGFRTASQLHNINGKSNEKQIANEFRPLNNAVDQTDLLLGANTYIQPYNGQIRRHNSRNVLDRQHRPMGNLKQHELLPEFESTHRNVHKINNQQHDPRITSENLRQDPQDYGRNLWYNPISSARPTKYDDSKGTPRSYHGISHVRPRTYQSSPSHQNHQTAPGYSVGTSSKPKISDSQVTAANTTTFAKPTAPHTDNKRPFGVLNAEQMVPTKERREKITPNRSIKRLKTDPQIQTEIPSRNVATLPLERSFGPSLQRKGQVNLVEGHHGGHVPDVERDVTYNAKDHRKSAYQPLQHQLSRPDGSDINKVFPKKVKKISQPRTHQSHIEYPTNVGETLNHNVARPQLHSNQHDKKVDDHIRDTSREHPMNVTRPLPRSPLKYDPRVETVANPIMQENPGDLTGIKAPMRSYNRNNRLRPLNTRPKIGFEDVRVFQSKPAANTIGRYNAKPSFIEHVRNGAPEPRSDRINAPLKEQRTHHTAAPKKAVPKPNNLQIPSRGVTPEHGELNDIVDELGPVTRHVEKGRPTTNKEQRTHYVPRVAPNDARVSQAKPAANTKGRYNVKPSFIEYVRNGAPELRSDQINEPFKQQRTQRGPKIVANDIRVAQTKPATNANSRYNSKPSLQGNTKDLTGSRAPTQFYNTNIRLRPLNMRPKIGSEDVRVFQSKPVANSNPRYNGAAEPRSEPINAPLKEQRTHHRSKVAPNDVRASQAKPAANANAKYNVRPSFNEYVRNEASESLPRSEPISPPLKQQWGQRGPKIVAEDVRRVAQSKPATNSNPRYNSKPSFSEDERADHLPTFETKENPKSDHYETDETFPSTWKSVTLQKTLIRNKQRTNVPFKPFTDEDITQNTKTSKPLPRSEPINPPFKEQRTQRGPKIVANGVRVSQSKPATDSNAKYNVRPSFIEYERNGAPKPLPRSEPINPPFKPQRTHHTAASKKVVPKPNNLQISPRGVTPEHVELNDIVGELGPVTRHVEKGRPTTISEDGNHKHVQYIRYKPISADKHIKFSDDLEDIESMYTQEPYPLRSTFPTLAVRDHKPSLHIPSKGHDEIIEWKTQNPLRANPFVEIHRNSHQLNNVAPLTHQQNDPKLQVRSRQNRPLQRTISTVARPSNSKEQKDLRYRPEIRSQNEKHRDTWPQKASIQRASLDGQPSLYQRQYYKNKDDISTDGKGNDKKFGPTQHIKPQLDEVYDNFNDRPPFAANRPEQHQRYVYGAAKHVAPTVRGSQGNHQGLQRSENEYNGYSSYHSPVNGLFKPTVIAAQRKIEEQPGNGLGFSSYQRTVQTSHRSKPGARTHKDEWTLRSQRPVDDNYDYSSYLTPQVLPHQKNPGQGTSWKTGYTTLPRTGFTMQQFENSGDNGGADNVQRLQPTQTGQAASYVEGDQVASLLPIVESGKIVVPLEMTEKFPYDIFGLPKPPPKPKGKKRGKWLFVPE